MHLKIATDSYYQENAERKKQKPHCFKGKLRIRHTIIFSSLVIIGKITKWHGIQLFNQSLTRQKHGLNQFSWKNVIRLPLSSVYYNQVFAQFLKEKIFPREMQKLRFGEIQKQIEL